MDEAPPEVMASMYKFQTSDQAISDMKRSVAEERWPDALGAAEALLKREPNHAEALRVQAMAKIEGGSQIRFNELSKALVANDALAMAKAWKGVAETSMYKERGRADFERVRAAWLESQENEVRALVRSGRCDEARRLGRLANDLFPQARHRIDDIAGGCRARDNEVAARDKEKENRKEDREVREISPSVSAPAPAVTPASAVAMVTEQPKSMIPESKPMSAEIPKPAPAQATSGPPKNIPYSELEPLRVAGERMPELPGNTKTIMRRDKVDRMLVGLKVCVNDRGVPTTVQMLKRSDYDEVNAKITADIKRWRFKPYVKNGQSYAVCAPVVLNYQLNWTT